MTIDVRPQILAIVQSPAQDLVAAYFAPGPFAGLTFDHLGTNDPGSFSADDLVAVSLLDVRFSPSAVRTLLQEESAKFNRLLRAIPKDVDLWLASDDDINSATELYGALKELPGVKRTKASKLMGRKRPRLIPIADSVVVKGLSLDTYVWGPIAEAMRDESTRRAIEALRPADMTNEDVSTLRLLDVAIWMRLSNSRNARKVRAGLSIVDSNS